MAQSDEALPFVTGVASDASQVKRLLEVGPGTLEVTEQMTGPGAAQVKRQPVGVRQVPGGACPGRWPR